MCVCVCVCMYACVSTYVCMYIPGRRAEAGHGHRRRAAAALVWATSVPGEAGGGRGPAEVRVGGCRCVRAREGRGVQARACGVEVRGGWGGGGEGMRRGRMG